MIEKIKIAVVGSGYWGPNLIRNVASLPDALLHTVCDINPKALQINAQRYPGVKTTPDFADVLVDSEVDGVVLATPAHMHAEMGRQALEAGKHLMVEKPLTLHAADAKALVELAQAKNLRLMVGHVFEYNPAVMALRDMVQKGELGKILYLYSSRLNLGIIRDDLNAMWNLAPHDFSIINYVLGGKTPEKVTARGFRLLGRKLEDVAFVTLEYATGEVAHVHVSWLDPGKVRQMTVVGEDKMAVYDDVSDERLKIYDKGVIPDKLPNDFGEFKMITRAGDIRIPKLDTTEPLRAECAHFVECIRTGRTPTSDGNDGYRVVQMLEAAQESMEHDGQIVAIKA